MAPTVRRRGGGQPRAMYRAWVYGGPVGAPRVSVHRINKGAEGSDLCVLAMTYVC